MRMYLRTERRAVVWPAAASTKRDTGEYAPEGPLGGYVECFRWGRDRFESETIEQVLPDGAVQLVFSLGDAYSAHVVGARSSPQTIRLSGTLEHVGVQLRPGGIAAALGIPAGELGNREVTLDEVWGAAGRELLERLAEIPLEHRPRVIGEALLERIQQGKPATDSRAAAAVQRILQSGGNVRVRDLSEQVGVTDRRLEQIFSRNVGISAKALCRVTRFRSAVDYLLETRQRSWVETALACGFYDQSHMVNEFRELAGVSPKKMADFGFFQDPSDGRR